VRRSAGSLVPAANASAAAFLASGPATFTGAFTHTIPVAAWLFLAAAALSLILPKAAVGDEHGH
jgi:hypothetical protein